MTFVVLIVKFLDNQSGVGTSKAKAIAHDAIECCLTSLGNDVKIFGSVI